MCTHTYTHTHKNTHTHTCVYIYKNKNKIKDCLQCMAVHMNDNSNNISNNSNKRIRRKSQIRSMGADKIVPTLFISVLSPPIY